MTKSFLKPIFACFVPLFFAACGENNAAVAGTDNALSGLSEEKYYNPTISYGKLKDGRDGQVYRTVQIGVQTWMAENLNYDYNMGTATSHCYNDSKDSCAKYGRLYTWSAAMDSVAIFSNDGKGCGGYVMCFANGNIRGVCPEGWHLPDSTEWKALVNYVELMTTDDAGYALKATNGWGSYNGVSGDGSDEFGFGALPAGSKYTKYYEVGVYTYFWTATERPFFEGTGKVSSYEVYLISLSSTYTRVIGEGGSKYGRHHSVRCIKD